MIIQDLRLERFGHFADAVLPLAPGLTLLYGPNEAGKSTLLEALRAFLFGFPRGQHFDFRFPSDSLAVAGTLAFADGATAELRREKKRGLKGKLGDLALSEELLRARLGRPSEPLYSTVFAFSLEDLARGGDALRDEGLRAALAGAGVGAVKSPQAVIEALRKQAEELFTAKGRSGKAITGALGAIKDERKALSDAQVRGDEYRARVGERDAARAEAARLGEERKRLLQRAGEAEALLRALPRRDELRGAEAERRALSPPPGLPPNADQEYARSRDERARLTERSRELADKLSRTQREAALIVVDEALLAAAARV
ncbi:MAG TPA: AAA family ATPase, partial [Polyangia bacterium]|nr:AAA family ATPase [Polyangia bacterium]